MMPPTRPRLVKSVLANAEAFRGGYLFDPNAPPLTPTAPALPAPPAAPAPAAAPAEGADPAAADALATGAVVGQSPLQALVAPQA